MPNSFNPPLGGIKILDLSRVLAGPHCTALLGDIGAHVLKVETPMHGDDSRHLGPFKNGESVYFDLINRGKDSLELDLKNENDLQFFYELVAQSDVIVENYRPGVAKRLKVDFDTAKEINPKIIYASISGFGQQGPLSQFPAYDITVQAMSGLMSVTGFPETGPTRVGESIGDIFAGTYAAWAISSALFARERGAQAQHIDVAMFDVMLSMQMTGLANFFANKKAPTIVGNRHPVSTPFDTYKAKDGLMVIAVANDKLFAKLCSAMSRDDLINSELFKTDPLRTKNESKLKQEMESWLSEYSVDDACELLLNQGIPAAPVWNLESSVNSEQSKARELFVAVEGSDIPIVPQPVFFNGVKPHATQPSPKLGVSNKKYRTN
ncbi:MULTISPECIES: CaiB/BaiF CoA-transferase family protein [unclassified Acinetobacter]|uniref:CaiB/BaiF CoA transferase family protein n=1 Tax=unclassified Acinetobacter TaxID=196816 RepID=UPI0015D1ABDE|nr:MULTISPECIES: CoA transferase [unclassified Acinetobacter]